MNMYKYLNKKEKITENYEKVLNKTVIWYPRSKEDAILQLEKLGIPAASQELIILPAGGVTVKSKVEQLQAAGRVLDKRLKHLNNSMPLEAYYYYINNNELYYSDMYDNDIFKELEFTEETIQENKEEFKRIRRDYFKKINDLWS